MNKLLSVIAGLFLVGAANAGMVSISSYSWDGPIATNSLTAICQSNGINLVSDYTQVDVETFYGTNASSMIIQEVAGNKDKNVFGWYDVSTPTVLNQIFPGPAGAGATKDVSFAPSTHVGFYLDPDNNALNGNAIFYSQASLNPGQAGQVAIFQSKTNSSDFVFGWEDLSLKNGTSATYQDPSPTSKTDGDFNDMILKVKVPEPATLSLIGLSLLSLSGLSLIRRRRS